MPQQNGIAVALYKCVRCVHFICVTIVCRRCRPKRKADDLQPDADDGDDDLVDVEGGQGVLPAATDEEFNDYSQPYAGLLSTQGFVGANNSNTGSSSVDSSRMVAGSAVSLRNEGFNSAGGRPLPVGIPTFPTQAGPAEVKDGLPVGVVADRFSHAGSPPAAVLREVGISSEDEEEDEDEEADSDDDDDESVPNLLNAPVPQFQAPAISLSKMTPRVIDQSSASSHQMSSLNVGANRQLERRQKREALLQQLQESKAASAVASPTDFFSDMGMAQTTSTVKAAVRVKHQDMIGASAGGIPLASATTSARFAADGPTMSGSINEANSAAAAWGAGDDDDLSDIDLSD